MFFWIFYVFESCFRAQAVILVLDFWNEVIRKLLSVFTVTWKGVTCGNRGDSCWKEVKRFSILMHNPVADLVQATPNGGCAWQREGECAGPHQLLPGQRPGHPANSTTDAGSPSVSATWSVYVMCRLLSVCVVCQLLDQCACGVSATWSVCVCQLLDQCVWCLSYLTSVCI